MESSELCQNKGVFVGEDLVKLCIVTLLSIHSPHKTDEKNNTYSSSQHCHVWHHSGGSNNQIKDDEGGVYDL